MSLRSSFSSRSWAATLERRGRVILIGSIVLSICCAFSLTRLRLDADVLGMLPGGKPVFDDFRFFVAEFGELNELVVLVRGDTRRRTEKFAGALGERLAELDTVRGVHVRIRQERLREGILGEHLYNYLPLAAYEQLRERLAPEAIDARVRALRAALAAPLDLRSAREVAEDPLGLRSLVLDGLRSSYEYPTPASEGGYFAAQDGKALLLFVEPREGAFDISFSESLMEEVGEAEAETRRALGMANVEVRYTGSYVYALEDAATMQGDLARYSVLALLGVLAVFFLGYRDLRVLPVVGYPMIVTALLTFAASVLMFDQLNAVSLSFAAILYGLSIDAGIHFYTRLLQESAGRDAREAVARTLSGLGRAHVTASLTTATVFALIGLSQLSPVRQLGWLTAVGMLLNMVSFFTLYPALGFVLLGRTGAPKVRLDSRLFETVAGSAVRFARPLCVTACVFAVAFLPAARRAPINASLDDLRPQDSAAEGVRREIASLFGGRDWSGAVLVRRSTPEHALIDAEAIDGVLAKMGADGTVARVQSVAGLLPSARTQEKRLARYVKLPRHAAAEQLRAALSRHGFESAPFERFLQGLVQPRSAIVRAGDPALEPLEPILARLVREHGGDSIVATYFAVADGSTPREVRTGLQRELPQLEYIFASRTLLEDELGKVLRAELGLFFVAASICSLLLLLLGLGSLRRAVAVFVPTLLVIEALFALIRLAGAAINPVNLIVLPMILGLSVDDGCYISAAEREHGGWTQALRHAGRALVLTSLTTITGFGFLALSRFPALASLGILAAAGLFLSMVSSVILVPAFCALLSKRGDVEK